MNEHHTQGRLTVGPDVIESGDGLPRTAIEGMDGAAFVAMVLDFGNEHPEMRSATARRLVAAWNFCERISTGDLETLDLPGYVTKQTLLTGVVPENGGVTVGMKGLGTAMLAASFAGEFLRSGAVNFLEVSFAHASTGPLLVTIQRKQGKTPADLRNEAEEALRNLRAQRLDDHERLATLSAAVDPDMLEAIAAEIDCHQHSCRAGSLRLLARQQRAAIGEVVPA